MIAYILDNKELKIKDIIEFEKYEFPSDIEYQDKSSITVARKPEIKDDDFVFCKDGNDIKFAGICDTYKSNSGSNEYQIILKQKENLFDRMVFVENQEMILAAGIEDFIANAIINNFVESGDPAMDKSYITVSAKTHTPVAAKVDAENGVYNLKTYLGNAKQYYGIFLDFYFSNGKLEIQVRKNNDTEIPIDIEVSDVSDYSESYEISVLAKLLVKWKIPDSQDSSGNTITGPVTMKTFYLLSDRSVSEDISNPNRADGTVKSAYIEAETEEEMRQQVTNEFSANQYNHKISFRLSKDSKLYPYERFYVGRKCRIKTKTGIKTSIVTKVKETSESDSVVLTFGNLKVTLIEKLRGER